MVTKTYYLAAASSEGNPFFALDPGIMLWVWIVFFLTLIILYTFAWKPILQVIDAREKRIDDSLKNASKVEKDLAETKEKVRDMMDAARVRIDEMLDEARKKAKVLSQNLEDNAHKQAKEIVEKGKQAIQQERELASKQLQEATSRIAIEIAGKILEENMGDKKNQELAERYLSEISLNQ